MSKRIDDYVQPYENKDIQIITRSASEHDNQREGMITIPIELTTRVPIKAQNFLANLLKTNLNVSQAAEMIGMSEGWGRKQMNKPECRAYFTALQNRESFYDVMSYNEVLATLSAIGRATPEQNDEMLNVKTGEVHELKVPSNTRVKALETLAKHHKILFNGPNEITHNANQVIVVDISETDAELIASRERSSDVIDVEITE
ncbi:terminase [Bacillus sp. LBA3-1-1.1]|uniref:terminase n=1 Tax=Bacillus TaxID=1386 RepID=UPI00341E80F4